MDIKDIDEHLSASGVLKLIEIKKAQSKAKLPNLLRSDGTAKKGNAIAVQATAQSISAADTVLKWIEDYMNSIEG